MVRESKLRPGFTLVELLLVIAIISLLAALLLPSLRHATAAAKSAACKNNLRQIGIGLSLYVNEFAKYPLAAGFWGGEGGPSWSDTLLPIMALMKRSCSVQSRA